MKHKEKLLQTDKENYGCEPPKKKAKSSPHQKKKKALKEAQIKKSQKSRNVRINTVVCNLLHVPQSSINYCISINTDSG